MLIKETKKIEEESRTPTIFRMKLPSNPFWTDLDCYQMEKELLKVNKKVIQDEFQQIFQAFQNGKSLGWKLNHIPSGHWCIFPIIDQGIVNEENCVKCPNTSTLLGSLPALMKNCVFGNACFSLLFPDSHIEPHYGPTNLRLRCHFGMHIPDGSWLEVDGTQVRWKEGEALVFDDSYEHSAYFGPQREHDKARVVLLLDFWHPSISKREKSILLQLLKPDE
ncbi:UNVERIFIED_CONTAM: hypothetical protein GTU68_066588 [Idotea baltica]|nr:hypothetical protein [Idotea baltica]